ncbi:Endocuticle structural glycoprotein SgAbd-2 [Trachymyrmex septentrionalis]|uniref:Endocuticle structural glycoprotein SgAbd-2 n=1 Tax=Trachymyrmex septentrionalis TaxID=34720 RepID=A0A195FPI2_9HYME|nr:Endocuticle structural glycoprotein SgAbd-2 [Trachymyrmex septentrionalis]
MTTSSETVFCARYHAACRLRKAVASYMSLRKGENCKPYGPSRGAQLSFSCHLFRLNALHSLSEYDGNAPKPAQNLVAALFGLVHGQYFQEPKKIVSYSHDLGDTRGHYSFSYETEGGILQRESGSRKYAGTSDETQLIQGSVQYNAPDGTPIAMSWTADEFGTQVSGSHIPTPPPIPPAIQRALEWIAKQPTTPEPIEKNNPTQNAVPRSDNRQFRLSPNKRN